MLADKVRSARRTSKDLWAALTGPLSPVTEAIKVAVMGRPDLDITLNFAGGHHHMTLVDITRDLEVVTGEVARAVGRNVRLRSATNSSKMEVVPDFPILDQLDDDLTLHLEFVDAVTEV